MAISNFRPSNAVLVLGLLSFLFFTSALALIVTGTSETGVSQDVTLSQVTLVKPADSVPGDMLLANITFNGGSAITIIPPSGWNIIKRTNDNSELGLITYWRIVGTSEPATFIWGLTPHTQAVGAITRFTGVDIKDPIDASADSSGKGNTAVAPSIYASSSHDRIVAIFATNSWVNRGSDFNTPDKMTMEYTVKKTPFGPTSALADSEQRDIGNTGPISSLFSHIISHEWIAQQIALRSNDLTRDNVAYWKFDEATGDAVDISGNNNTLSNTNAVVFQAGKINNAAVLNASSSQFFKTLGGEKGLDFTGDYSVSFWVKLNSLPGHNEYRILTKGAGLPQEGSASYNVIIAEGAVGVNEIYTLWTDGGLGSPQSHIGEYDSPANYFNDSDIGRWVHVVIVADVAHQNVVSYKNGMPTTLFKRAGSNATSVFKGTGKLSVGSQLYNNDQSAQRFLDGQLDELGIWSRTLKPDEVSALYNSGRGIQFPF